ncbi:hypothetical protein D8S78_05840 [Natrialba swarupiae]|nr:hypothetical protein [Natrialba swarupiae]
MSSSPTRAARSTLVSSRFDPYYSMPGAVKDVSLRWCAPVVSISVRSRSRRETVPAEPSERNRCYLEDVSRVWIPVSGVHAAGRFEV